MNRSPGDLIHDALDVHGFCYHEPHSGLVDGQSGDIAAALLAAGWKLPDINQEGSPDDQARPRARRFR